MIISDEQARLAAHYLASPCSGRDCATADAVSPETLAAAHAVVARMPEMRSDRIQDAHVFLNSAFTSHEVASKMISRIISDSLR